MTWRTLARDAFLALCAGAGIDLQMRVMDHFLDRWFSAVSWLSWLVQ
jgi:hypothetical protein